MTARTRLYFDGGCRPAGMETAVVLRGVAHIAHDLGPGDSLDAEWLALIAAVRLAQAHDLTDPVFLGDSRAAIAQATGLAMARGKALSYLATFRALIGERPPRIRYIRRSQNLAGIALDRRHDGAVRQPFPCVFLA